MENSQTDASQLKKMAEELNDKSSDLGSREVLKGYKNLIFKPAEADLSVTYGWFYHESLYYFPRKRRTAKYLADVFFNTVGGNASMLLNVPPDTDGLISKREIETLTEFTRLIRAPFRHRIECNVTMLNLDGSERPIYDNYYDFNDDETSIKIAMPKDKKLSTLYLEEDLKYSQRVEEFKVFAKKEDEVCYREIYTGTVIGSGKIIRFPDFVEAEEIVITPTQSRKNPILKKVLVFSAK
jgi:alpha-L-fucosidase